MLGLVEALAVTGRGAEAEMVLRRACRYADDLGLLAGQVDTTTGELLAHSLQGVQPSHLGLVLAAQASADARKLLTSNDAS